MGTDFNDDGRDDILWRHDDGTLTNWLGTKSGGFIENYAEMSWLVPGDWTVWAIGDFFNNDGRDDILLRNDNGTLANGTWTGWDGWDYGMLFVPVPTDWTIAGTGDFDGDGLDDILWRHDNGTLTNWLGTTNHQFAENYSVLSVQVPVDWHVAGTGDFNGDGEDDILWRHSSGTLTNWLGTDNGGFTENYGVLSRDVPIAWRVADTGDFNGDGRDDILWLHDNGTLTNWLATDNGGFVENYGALSRQAPSSWRIVETGDFNGDGRDDILWRANGVGTLTDWLGTDNGGFIENDDALYVEVPLAWHVQPNPSGLGEWDY